MSRLARAHLTQADPVLGALISEVGRCGLVHDRTREPYAALISAVAHQQLHARAATAILGRLATLAGAECPAPAALLSLAEVDLRGCGFSGAKIAALRDIAARTLDGTVPTRRAASRLSDAELIERLCALRGIGRWTVEMLLIFTLGRPDVFPVDDFGVREGYRVIHGLAAQPKPRDFAVIGEAYAPYRTTAAWYLWRAADRAKETAKGR
ncbi:MAG: DNA-3-methyladenine glycosylase [Acidiphilium sp. 37-64-53]|uniref:DNA-3-methyladenine glycosylase family protein n=1 Tax=Acidiphilium TaxID=522 RepID=UPI000BCDE68B|nr:MULTISPECIES: DNA-3-methyladenine glycosylase 2 family protein [Acidiphilium]OYW00280.1 MAG: DNA-3-methyladenine glycosylase [Acidiphilium sp. 37-64-53]OZB24611.1 MAG: DNA-3-methyladenine glycosylase [Acidiphilium sp. 34-64-41]HQT86590.1 DNA-3-methyladenine glycosylase 2 family protein [Acidiphilium rubrum]